MIYHLHIPKAAGGTILAMLKEQYHRKVLALPARHGWHDLTPTVKATHSVISGHFPFDAHQMVHDDRPRYFTFLRHPIERVASLYAYIMYRGRGHAAYPIASRMTPYEFAARGPADNTMVRQLSGRNDFAWFDDKEQVTQYDLALAKDNLHRCFWVGDVEHLHADIDVLGQLLSWEPMAIPHINASLGKPRIEVTGEVERKWRWDIALWEWWLEHRDNMQKVWGGGRI